MSTSTVEKQAQNAGKYLLGQRRWSQLSSQSRAFIVNEYSLLLQSRPELQAHSNRDRWLEQVLTTGPGLGRLSGLDALGAILDGENVLSRRLYAMSCVIESLPGTRQAYDPESLPFMGLVWRLMSVGVQTGLEVLSGLAWWGYALSQSKEGRKAQQPEAQITAAYQKILTKSAVGD